MQVAHFFNAGVFSAGKKLQIWNVLAQQYRTIENP